MQEEKAVAIQGSAAVEIQPQGQADIMSVIARAASDHTFNVDTMERLLAMQERMEERQRQAEFNAAMSRLHAAMPRISKEGRIVIAAKEGKTGSVTKFARLEDIDRAVRPLLDAEGMSLSFDTQWVEGRVMVIGKLSHINGHSETKQIPLPLDVSGSKNNVQAAGSTVSYGRRYLVKMFFNIIEDGEDNDGAGAPKIVTQKQADELNDLLTEIGGGERERFLKWAGVAKVAEVPADKFDRGMAALLKKRSGV